MCGFRPGVRKCTYYRRECILEVRRVSIEGKKKKSIFKFGSSQRSCLTLLANTHACTQSRTHAPLPPVSTSDFITTGIWLASRARRNDPADPKCYFWRPVCQPGRVLGGNKPLRAQGRTQSMPRKSSQASSVSWLCLRDRQIDQQMKDR